MTAPKKSRASATIRAAAKTRRERPTKASTPNVRKPPTREATAATQGRARMPDTARREWQRAMNKRTRGGGARVVLLLLSDRAMRQDLTGAYGSHADLADRANVSERYVRNVLTEAAAAGMLVRTQRGGNRYGGEKVASRYDLLPPAEWHAQPAQSGDDSSGSATRRNTRDRFRLCPPELDAEQGHTTGTVQPHNRNRGATQPEPVTREMVDEGCTEVQGEVHPTDAAGHTAAVGGVAGPAGQATAQSTTRAITPSTGDADPWVAKVAPSSQAVTPGRPVKPCYHLKPADGICRPCASPFQVRSGTPPRATASGSL